MNKKNQIIAVISVVVVVFVVFIYFKNSSNDISGSSVVAEQKVTEFAGAREILSLLNRMSNVKLDDSIFADDSFKSLKDTTVVLVEQPVGRINPFAPLGTEGMRSTSSRSTTPAVNTQPQNRTTPFGGNVAPER